MGKVIFCDDDRFIQKLVRVALRSLQHELHVAGDGAEGLELIERERPDVVFSDVSMPRLDGLQLVDALKSRPHLAHIPIVLVTASVQRHQVEEAYRHGIAGYITKPFDLNELRARVEEFLTPTAGEGEH